MFNKLHCKLTLQPKNALGLIQSHQTPTNSNEADQKTKKPQVNIRRDDTNPQSKAKSDTTGKLKPKKQDESYTNQTSAQANSQAQARVTTTSPESNPSTDEDDFGQTKTQSSKANSNNVRPAYQNNENRQSDPNTDRMSKEDRGKNFD